MDNNRQGGGILSTKYMLLFCALALPEFGFAQRPDRTSGEIAQCRGSGDVMSPVRRTPIEADGVVFEGQILLDGLRPELVSVSLYRDNFFVGKALAVAAAETDGVFRFRNVEAGTYVARVQVAGHADVHVYGVEIKPGQKSALKQNVTLKVCSNGKACKPQTMATQPLVCL